MEIYLCMTCIHEHLPTDNLHTCISTLTCVYREPFHNASICPSIHVYMCAKGPATVPFYRLLPLKKAFLCSSETRKVGWVNVLLTSPHGLACLFVSFADPISLSQGTYITYIPTSYPLQLFLRLPLGTCSRDSYVQGRGTQGQTYSWRDQWAEGHIIGSQDHI